MTTVIVPPAVTAVTAGLCWLYDTIQPADALIERRGARLTVGDRVLRFLPIGPAKTPLIVVDVVDVRWGLGAAGRPLNTLPRGELDALSDELARLNIPTTAMRYHGITGTVALDVPAHPSVLAAVERFDQGCPYHHSQVCEAPVRDRGQGCTWHIRGHQAAIWPHLYSTPSQTAS